MVAPEVPMGCWMIRWLSTRRSDALALANFHWNLKSVEKLSTTGKFDAPNNSHRTKHRSITQRACHQGRNSRVFSTGKSDAHRSNASDHLRQLSEGSMATSRRSLTESSDALPSEVPMLESSDGLQRIKDNSYKMASLSWWLI